MEMSLSQEWLGKAIRKHTAATNHTAHTVAIEILDIFWFPRCSDQGMITYGFNKRWKENSKALTKCKPLTS